MSRPAWGAWIEICWVYSKQLPPRRRAPHGARGLKYQPPAELGDILGGRAPHGARGLKFGIISMNQIANSSRAPHGARGLKYVIHILDKFRINGRAPHGARGLKSFLHQDPVNGILVAPRMGRVD